MNSPWPFVPLSSVLTQDRSYIYELEDRPYPKLSVKLYGRGCVLDGFTDGKEVKMKRHQLAKPGQVILSEIWGKKGAIGIVPEEGKNALVTSHFFLFYIDGNKVIVDWLFWLIKANFFESELSVKAKGSTGYAAVRPNQFLDLLIPLPSLEDQQRIISKIRNFFNCIEEVMELQQDAIRETENLTISVLNSFFSEEEMISWDNCSLGDLAEIVSGVTLGRKIETAKISVSYLRVANVQDGWLNLEEIKEVEIRPHEFEKWRLKPGDLLLTEGGDFDKLGRGTVWNGEIPNCIHQNHIFRVRLDQSRIIPEFLELEIRSSYGKDYFLSKAKKTTNLASINQTQLRAFPVRYPSLQAQESIIKRMLDLENALKLLLEEQSKSQTILEALLPSILDKAFTGVNRL